MVKGSHLSEESRRKISIGLTGIKRSSETRKRMSGGKKGIIFSSTHLKNLSVSHLGQSRPHTIESKEKIRQSKLGERNYNWKGGVSGINYRIRRSARYKEWRKSVYERDNYTCVICHTRGGKLNADHIKAFADFPELRFELSNGRTLCFDCHKKTPTYGWNKLHRSAISASR